MSQAIVRIQQGSFTFAFSLLQQFITVCPDDVWTKKFGGWPVWQQVYHTLAAMEFFVAAPEYEPVKGLVAPEVTMLKVVGEHSVDKAQMKAFAKDVKAVADAYMDTLTDADLAQKAEGASLRMGNEMSHAAVVALMIGHVLYHLGSCDAALREQGLKGVF
jgi:hypothetical protein